MIYPFGETDCSTNGINIDSLYFGRLGGLLRQMIHNQLEKLEAVKAA